MDTVWIDGASYASEDAEVDVERAAIMAADGIASPLTAAEDLLGRIAEAQSVFTRNLPSRVENWHRRRSWTASRTTPT
jgi:hypothetical protein